MDQIGLKLTAPNATSPGVLQRINLSSGDGISPTRTIEAPVLPGASLSFTRTLAPLPNRSAIIGLTQGGFTVFPWNYDSAINPPRIERVVNAADQTQPIAPNGLISVFGQNMSPINQAASAGPLPTSLTESCLQVNGLSIPVLFVSPRQINAQLPLVEGNVTMRLLTPSGVSDNFNLTVLPNAPSVFRIAVADDERPAVYRASNNTIVTQSNPVHRGDSIIILATGLGRTLPEISPGEAAPQDTLAVVTTPPTVTIGGVPVEVAFAGLVPGQIGLYQINVVVHHQVPTGLAVPLAISQGSGSTSMTVRVVN
jgi:uncharacterized protein (TIGR03437 family)